MADDRSAQEYAADLAVLRMSENIGNADLFRAHQTDRGKTDDEVGAEFGRVASRLMATAHESLHAHDEDHTVAELAQAMFVAGFVYGRTFEELQVLELHEINNLTFTHKKGTKK